jgi:phage tail sheath gpL-like
MFATEFDNSKAIQGPATKEYNVLVMGQKLSTGIKDELVKYVITSDGQARQNWGAGSMIAEMCAAFRANSQSIKLTGVAIDDSGSGVVATGSQVFAGTATAAGVIYFYLAGLRVKIAVAIGDTDEDIVAALVAAIALEPNRLMNAAINGVDAKQIDFTARNLGAEGTDLDFRFNYNDGEAFPAGIILGTTTAMVGGASNPDIAEIIAVMGDTQWDFVICPWNDATNLTLLETELTRRWGPLAQNDGRYIGSKRGSYATLSTLGSSRNSLQGSISMWAGPTAAFIASAMIAGQVSTSSSIDQARPYQTLVLVGALPPNEEEQLTFDERDLLLHDGIATNKVVAGGKVAIERMITLYQTNDFGADDESYLDLNTPTTLSYLRYDWNNHLALTFPRAKLANDGTRIAAGQSVATPKAIKAEHVAKLRQWEELGLVENVDEAIANLVVDRPSTSVVTVDVLTQPDLVNQLRIARTKIQYIL